MNQKDLVALLLIVAQNLDVFAWSLYDILGVDPKFITHKLNMDLSLPPKK